MGTVHSMKAGLELDRSLSEAAAEMKLAEEIAEAEAEMETEPHSIFGKTLNLSVTRPEMLHWVSA